MKWGLALSAGSALGMANAGVIQRLEEEGLRPDAIAASSMGAIIGSLYALGYPPTMYRSLAKDINLTNIVQASDAPFRGGLLHGGMLRQRLREHLEPYIGNAKVGDCRIPFYCVAGRIKEPIQWQRIILQEFAEHVTSCMETYVFPPETRLLDAIMASSAIPVVFSPVTIGNDTFVDVCNFGAIPARELREHAHPDVVIATNTLPVYRFWKSRGPRFLRQWLEWTESLLAAGIKEADLVIAPSPVAASFRFDKFKAFMREGWRATDAAMPEIRKLLDRDNGALGGI